MLHVSWRGMETGKFFHKSPFIWLAWRRDGVQAVRVMLDIRVIRENPEGVKARLKPRSGDVLYKGKSIKGKMNFV